MKTKIISVFLLLIILFAYVTQTKFILQKSYTSPSNNYILELYVEREHKPFFSLSSEQDFAEAYVILKNKEGRVLLEPHWYASCTFPIGDLMIDWTENRVYFTKFNYIDLTSFSFDCY